MSEEAEGLVQLWKQIGPNIQVLGIAGASGAFVRALMVPEGDVKRRIAQSLVGILAAIFIGSIVGSMFEGMVSHPAYAYLAAGFICGTLGEGAVAWAQRKFLQSEKDRA